jgi:hypothetical protein
MMRITRGFRSLPMNVVFTAKIGATTDDIAKVTRFGPLFPGQLYGQQVPYLMDLLLCLRVNKDGTRYLQTQPDLQYICKDRSGKLGKQEAVTLGKPTLATLFSKVTS